MYFGSYKPLSDEDVRAVHEATLRILEEVGLAVHNERALHSFATGGALVDAETHHVRLPRRMVLEHVRGAPGGVTFCARSGRADVGLGNGRTFFSSGGTASNVVDFETGELRHPTLLDVEEAARLCDSLPNVDVCSLPVVPMDVPEEHAQIQRVYTTLKNTSKPVMGSVLTPDEASKVIRIAQIIAGGESELRARPILSVVACATISPLMIDDQATGVFLRFIEEGLPAVVPIGPTAGMTAPMTLAGTLVVQNAEALTMVTLGQLVNTGTPVVYAVFPGVSDPRTMAYVGGSVEAAMLSAGASQMAQLYDLPSVVYAGMTDANVPDGQAAYEKASAYHLAAASGADMVANCGMLQSLSAIALEEFVIDDEIFGGVARAMSGIHVSEEALGMAAIEEAGPGGNFLTSRHTIQFMRGELRLSDLSSRLRWDEWTEQGRPDTRARARAAVRRILAGPRAPSFSDDVDRQIRQELPWLAP